MIFAWGVVAVRRNASTMEEIEVRAGVEQGKDAQAVAQKILRHADIAFPSHTFAVKVSVTPIKDLSPFGIKTLAV